MKPQSIASGFVALRTGNGRITLMTSPTGKTPLKVVVSGDNGVDIDVVAQNGRLNGSDISLRIGYSVGHDIPVTTTPTPTTTKPPQTMASVKIYILEVNAQVKEVLTGALFSQSPRLCNV